MCVVAAVRTSPVAEPRPSCGRVDPWGIQGRILPLGEAGKRPLPIRGDAGGSRESVGYLLFSFKSGNWIATSQRNGVKSRGVPLL